MSIEVTEPPPQRTNTEMISLWREEIKKKWSKLSLKPRRGGWDRTESQRNWGARDTHPRNDPVETVVDIRKKKNKNDSDGDLDRGEGKGQNQGWGAWCRGADHPIRACEGPRGSTGS